YFLRISVFIFSTVHIVSLLFSGLAALLCYACSYTLDQSDASCVTNVSAVRVLNCTHKYCLTMRQELMTKGNKVNSFLRDCQDKPVMLNGVKSDGLFRTYYRSCQQDMCNGHNGRVYNSSGAGGSAAGGGGHLNVILPGKSGKACLTAPTDFLLLLFLMLP
ncbi:hypothetical protein KR222_007745, partial [Zaprionus bogoriensis]